MDARACGRVPRTRTHACVSVCMRGWLLPLFPDTQNRTLALLNRDPTEWWKVVHRKLQWYKGVHPVRCVRIRFVSTRIQLRLRSDELAICSRPEGARWRQRVAGEMSGSSYRLPRLETVQETGHRTCGTANHFPHPSHPSVGAIQRHVHGAEPQAVD